VLFHENHLPLFEKIALTGDFPSYGKLLVSNRIVVDQ
jgi:hypothetical protein